MLRTLMATAGAVLVMTGAASPTGAAAPTPSVEAYGRLPALTLVRLSPSGERLAYIAEEGGDRVLVVTNTYGEPLVRTPVGDAKVRDIRWAGDNFALVQLSKTYNLGWYYSGAHELSQVLVVDLAGGKSYWVFERGRMVNSVFGVYGLVQHDGRWYGHFGGVALESGKDIIEDGYVDLYRVDLATGETKRLASASDQERDWVVGADGSILANSAYDSGSTQWRLWAGDDRKRLIAEEKDPYGGGNLVGLGRTTGSVVYGSHGADGAMIYREADGPGPGVALADAKPIAGFLRDPATGLLIGYRTSGDQQEDVLFSPKLQARVRGTRKAFPADQLMSLVSWNAAFDRMVVFTEGPGESGTYWLVDIKTGRADDLGRTYPAVEPEHVGTSRMIDYKAADGLALRGVLTLPPGREAKDLPLVVLPHGGPQARDGLGFDWWAQAFASRGYAVFQPNFRGSSGYGAAFVDAGHGEWGRKMQTDISDGIAALAAQGVVDAKRACIVGGSYGGYAALAGVTVQNGFYRCAVSMAGISDLSAMLRWEADRHGRVSEEMRYWKDFMGAKSWSDTSLRDISPAELAKRADAPVLLIHGKDDTVVPIEQSRIMERALRRADKPVEFVELPGEDHWLSGASTRVSMLRAAVAFVEKHNPADAAPTGRVAP
ncbi:S9 family peptidase [Caulobacter sp. 17J65-9]|uniref:alpha/beta hydrolase family protein n=1 Tax=Caulobacter sp. 17J65-9 TaxID=2709382 RepID=UPI0013C8741D|nr:S9 family peptidase [Caulobacter sp. 17J65-9]NEX92602.1 S9 family peptidase [Caulobacter sp. 17J65-9]